MFTKYKLCRIAASLGVAIAFVVLTISCLVYWERTLVIFEFLWMLPMYVANIALSSTTAVAITSLFLVLVICWFANESPQTMRFILSDVVFATSTMFYLAFVSMALFDNVGKIYPPGSNIAVIPSLGVLLFAILYHSELFKFCKRFEN